jgi:hypothetical protein
LLRLRLLADLRLRLLGLRLLWLLLLLLLLLRLRLCLLVDLGLWLSLGLLWRSFLSRRLRAAALGARMLRVLTASRRVLGDNDRPRRRRSRDAFGGHEPLRQRQCGNRRDRQQGAFAGRLYRSSFLKNLGQDPLLGVAAPFIRAHTMNSMDTRLARLASYYGRTLMAGNNITINELAPRNSGSPVNSC